MNSVLNELRKNREENKNKNDKNKKIYASLDLTFKDLEDPSKNLSLVPFTKPKNE